MKDKTEGVRVGAGMLATLVVTLALAACGGSATTSPHTQSASSSAPQSAPSSAPAEVASLDGPVLANPAPVPPLALHNYLGQPVNLADYRGRAVLLTFIYTHCPDVCPIIVANLHNALALLGHNASKVQIVAVSTDPRGDTHAAIAGFLARREMTGRMQYLVGTRSQLTPVWRAWGISASKPTATDEVAHSAVVYGITAGGMVKVAYPANFTPAMIAHDVPLLAGS